MIQIPDRYEPITIGRDPYVSELQFVEPYVYAFGFEQATDPNEALEIVVGIGGHWEFAEPRYVVSLVQNRSEYRFVHTDGDAGLSPGDLRDVTDADNPIRYIVPIYSSDEPGVPPYTLVPNHVVVTLADLSIVDPGRLDELAAQQEFFPLTFRDVSRDSGFRRTYSSLVDRPMLEPPDEFIDYRGEPGPALRLINVMIDEVASAEFAAEPDWYLDHPDDLGTPATTVQHETDVGYEAEA
jgi:hypothetical protein